MIYLTNMTQALEGIDYTWNKPKTYFIFMPGLSLMILKIQLANISRLIKDIQLPEDSKKLNPKGKYIDRDVIAQQLTHICKCHLMSSLFQITSAIIAIKIFKFSSFSRIFKPVLHELYQVLSKSLKNRAIFYKHSANDTLEIKQSNQTPQVRQ